MTVSKIAVGDTVIIFDPRKNVEPIKAVVTKVARKYFTVEYAVTSTWSDYVTAREEQFSIETGRERNDPNCSLNYARFAYTPEAHAQKVRRDEAEKKLTEFGITFSFRGTYGTVDKLPTDKLLAIVDILSKPDD